MPCRRSRLFSFVCLLTSSLVVSMLLFFLNGIRRPTPTSHLCSLKHVLFPTFLCTTLFDCQSADVLSPIGLLISSMFDYVFWCIRFQPAFCILLTDVLQFLPAHHTLCILHCHKLVLLIPSTPWFQSLSPAY